MVYAMQKTKIEWCDSTWSPVTGCMNDCDYCYAMKTANRFKGCESSPDGSSGLDTIYLTERQSYVDKGGRKHSAAYPYGFIPTFHEYRLKDLTTKGLGETIWVCSTGELFGQWIPDEWIQKVFDACLTAEGHRYIFITKYPERYYRLAQRGLLPTGDQFWYGTTATGPDKPIFYSDKHHTFVNFEPVLEPLGHGHNDIFNQMEWAVFGAETGNRKDKVVPRREWVEDAVLQFRQHGIPVFMQDSMVGIWPGELMRETPWGEERQS